LEGGGERGQKLSEAYQTLSFNIRKQVFRHIFDNIFLLVIYTESKLKVSSAPIMQMNSAVQKFPDLGNKNERKRRQLFFLFIYSK
jgi:hypothetical protein